MVLKEDISDYHRNKDFSHVNSIPNVLERMEGDDFLEEVEEVVSSRCVREVCNGGGARPWDDRDKEDTNKDSASDTVKHKENSENAMQWIRYAKKQKFGRLTLQGKHQATWSDSARRP
jgi:hypothetical protein